MRRLLLLLALLSLVTPLLASPARALTIRIDSIQLNAGNSPDSATNRSVVEVLQAADSVPDVSGGPFAEVHSRWAGTVFAGDVHATATADYQLVFTVEANPGVVYNVVIFQELIGGFSFFDDSAGNATARAGDVSGSLGGIPDPRLSMPAGVEGERSSSTTTSIPFFRNRLLELDNLTGTQTFTLDFSFGIEAESTTDEVAVQLGLADPGGNPAAAYPGVGLRDAAQDGHFLSLQSRVIFAIPEPGTLPLLALGLALLSRRRRRSP